MPDARATLLLTRPRAQAERFAASCRNRIGADLPIVVSPIIEIIPTGNLVDLAGVSGVVLTSENAVRVLAQSVTIKGVKAYCVGDRTAQVAEDMGMKAVSAKGNADDLVQMIRAFHPNGNLLHPHGVNTRGNIADQLNDIGITTHAICIYDQEKRALNDEARRLLADEGSVILPLFSPRSAALLGAEIPSAKAALYIVALSEAVAEDWKGQTPENFTVALRPKASHMIDEIAAIWSGLQS